MKLHEHAQQELNTITAYGEGYVEINARRHDGSILVMPLAVCESWSVATIEVIDDSHIAALLTHEPEIVIIGTGQAQRFLPPKVLAPLTNGRIGHEVMTTPSACRTYNILMAEGRKVLAALLPVAG